MVTEPQLDGADAGGEGIGRISLRAYRFVPRQADGCRGAIFRGLSSKTPAYLRRFLHCGSQPVVEYESDQTVESAVQFAQAVRRAILRWEFATGDHGDEEMGVAEFSKGSMHLEEVC